MVFWGGVGRIVSVGGFSMLVGFLMVSFFPLGAADRGIDLGIKLGCIAAAIFGVHVIISGIFGLEEARPIFRWIKRLVIRPVRQPFNPQ